MKEIAIRFLIGGSLVCVFAALGDVFKPKSFAGLFAAAPSIALATLALTVAHDGAQFAAREARSMIAGAVPLWLYTSWVAWACGRLHMRVLPVATLSIGLWGVIAVGCGWLLAGGP